MEKDWPKAKESLELLLSFINPDKPILSVDYSVTNSFKAKKSDGVLNPSILFEKSNGFIAPQISQLTDPRWHFDQGWFDASTDPRPETLVRVNGHGRIEENWVIATVGSLYARLYGASFSCNIGTLLGPSGSKSLTDEIFDDFHSKSKKLLGCLLVPDLVERMGLDAA
ncbi:MAG: hypothetical protein OXE94_07990 [Aestuariivita sp.]|nr:hypothetical protein [Aestuariivita sp.]MCY4204033.1 hypothetical protein [Aestuariivita sp.]MCY4289766.1 hypothetical protein [Aestuariivita sp.]MCY4347644.1 hypothetical protein [Aestuariivita sp.]